MQTTCPHCHETIDFDGESLPEQFSCRSCGADFVHTTGETVTVIGDDPDETATYVRTPSESLAESSGNRLGDYELIKEIGRGGMGVVYQARQKSLNRVVAIKTIRSGELADDEHIQRFYVEAEAAARLDHPHIVPVYEVGEHQGRHFFSMGFVEGESLAESISDGPLPPRQAAEVVRTIADAVAFAHGQGIVHRDLKPRNILIDKNGQPHITDFGLAKRIDADSELTATGQVMGTPSYMPPEQAAGRTNDVDVRSDIYSVGAVLYHSLTGRPPFQAANVIETLLQVQFQDPVPPRTLNPAIDKDLETICLKCLNKERTQRYHSVDELSNDVRRFLAGEPIAARPSGRTERAWRWAKRHPARAGLAVAMLLLLLMVVGIGVSQSYQARLHESNTALRGANGQLESANSELAQLNGDLIRAKESIAKSLGRERTIRGQLEKANDEIDQLLYIRRVNAALVNWNKNEAGPAQQALLDCPPELRGWEWHYVHRLCHPELSSHKLRGSDAATGHPSISPDGRFVAYPARPNRAVVWSAATGEAVLQLRGHTKSVQAVEFSPDGRLIATGSADHLVRLWDAKRGEPLRVLKGHESTVFGVTFSPDSQLLATASHDHSIRLWNVETGDPVRTMLGHSKAVVTLKFSPDGKRIASAGHDRSIRIWNTETGKNLVTIPVRTTLLRHLAFSPDGRKIATAVNASGLMATWDVLTGKPLLTLQGHRKMVQAIEFSHNGQHIASGAYDRTVRIWNASNGKELLKLRGHADSIDGVLYSVDDQRLTSVGRNKTGEVDRCVKVWEVDGKSEPREAGHSKLIMCVAFSPDGLNIASGSADKTVKIWNSDSGQVTRTLKGHTDQVYSVAYSPDGQSLASAGADHTVKIWNLATGEEIQTIRGHANNVSSLAFSPDGKRLASASWDNTFKIWDTSSGQQAWGADFRIGLVGGVAFSPDGRLIAIAGTHDACQVWDVANQKILWKHPKPFSMVHSVTFAPDGKSIVTASVRKMTVWETATGKQLLNIRGHYGVVHNATYSPDGQRIASVGSDNTVRIWEAVLGEELLTLDGTPGTNMGHRVVFSPDGRRIAGATGYSVRVWDARSGMWPNDLSAAER